MKLNIAATPVEHVGAVAETKQFGIKSTGKAFQVLSSKLYKNKIAAAIRELSANAYDSHVAVWRGDRPFEVHLPTVFEPFFSVRDFGTGLTHTAVVTIFTTFFESTKDGSNDYIGALGLGSKSPFALVDSFVVYTFDGKERSTYECYLENGIPQIARKASVASNEEAGVEINFAVATDDIPKFAKEAALIYQWFRVRPTLTGAEIHIPDLPELRGSCWSLAGGQYCTTMSAIMGQVCYPIDPEIVGTKLKNLVVHFDIGEVDIQAGREELSYDKATIAAIQARLATVEAEIDAIYEEMFQGCETIFDASFRASQTKDRTMFEIKKPHWRGMPIAGSLSQSLKGEAYLDDFGDREKLREADIEDLTLFMCDVERGAVTRFNIWRATPAGADKLGYRVVPELRMSRERAKEIFGDIPMVWASSIPLPPLKAKLRTMTRSTTYDIRNKADRSIDLNAGGVYIVSKNLAALHPDSAVAASSNPTIGQTPLTALHEIMLDEIFTSAKDDGKPDDVVIIPWSRRSEIGDNWTNVYDLMRGIYDEKMKDPAFRTGLKDARTYHGWYSQETDGVMTRIDSLVGGAIGDGPVKSFIDVWKRCKTASKTFDRWRVYQDMIDRPKGEHKSMMQEWLQLRRDFPLLMDVCRQRNYHERVDNIVANDLALYVDTKTQRLAGK